MPPPVPGPLSFPSGPVYPGSPPAFRAPGGYPAPPPNGGRAAVPQQAPYEAPPPEPVQPYGSSHTYGSPQSYGAQSYSAPQSFGGPQSYGAAQPQPAPPSYGTAPQPYGAAQSYAAPPEAYGQQAYAPPEPGYGPPAYDTGATQVFETGGLRGDDPFGDSMATGVIPSYSEDFGRTATARIDFGPHEAFGPPPEEVEPEPEPDAATVFSRFRRIRSHAREKRRRKGGLAVVLVLVLFAVAAGVRFAPFSPWHRGAGSTTSEKTAAPLPFHDATFTATDVGTTGFVSWAYQDWRDGNGSVVGSDNEEEATQAASMISAWFAADLLRRAAEQGVEPSETDKADIEAMIRDDDLAAAERIVATLGYEDSISRLSSMCRLSATTAPAESWRDTVISAEDAARLGGCLGSGAAAGAEWTPWLLNVMRQVRGSGDFGIRTAFPADQRPSIAIKNGVMLDQTSHEWRANCLAVGDGWSLAVMQRFAASDDADEDLAHIDMVCQQVVWHLTR